MSLIFIGAHAFGNAFNPHIPLYLFVVGGGIVVFVSFLFILPTEAGGQDIQVMADWTGIVRRVRPGQMVGLVILGLMVIVGFVGAQTVAANIVPTIFWLFIWVAVPILCGLFGDWMRFLNPFVPIAMLAERRNVRQVLLGRPILPWPGWLGWWPATALLFALACGELIFDDYWTLPASVALGIVQYSLITFTGALVFGADAWLERAEVFSVLFATWGRLGWFRFGAPGSRGILGGVWDTEFEASRSRIIFVLLLLVSISFDGLLATPTWKNIRLTLPNDFQLGTWRYELAQVAAFILLLLIVWTVFRTFAWAVARAGKTGDSPRQSLGMLLPSMLPIAFGYLLSHNADYLAINGQEIMPLLANPFGFTSWPTAPYPFNSTYVVNANLVPTSVIWYAELVVIVAVHIAAILIAHRYLARRCREKRYAKRAEWPWIGAMVLYTMSSLWLLAQPVLDV